MNHATDASNLQHNTTQRTDCRHCCKLREHTTGRHTGDVPQGSHRRQRSSGAAATAHTPIASTHSSAAASSALAAERSGADSSRRTGPGRARRGRGGGEEPPAWSAGTAPRAGSSMRRLRRTAVPLTLVLLCLVRGGHSAVSTGMLAAASAAKSRVGLTNTWAMGLASWREGGFPTESKSSCSCNFTLEIHVDCIFSLCTIQTAAVNCSHQKTQHTWLLSTETAVELRVRLFAFLY